MSSTPRDPAPFELTCTPAVPELLRRLGCSIALTTYQAGKLVFVSALDDARLVQLPRTFHRPMALRRAGESLFLSTAGTVERFVSDPRMARAYPRQPETYDTLYLPRASYVTGHLDVHGIELASDGTIWFVNTKFACLARLDDVHSFVPLWRPHFITETVPQDRCHLNGVAFRDGRPSVATCLSTTDTEEGWRATLPNAGVLIDVASNTTIVSGLAMPHSPRYVGDALYLLLSATGDLARVDVQSGKVDVVTKVGGFVRGMAYYRSHLFIAHSKLRKNSSTFRDLPIADEATTAGVVIVHEPTGAVVGRLAYGQSVDEIFDVEILPDQMRPGIVGLDRPERQLAITTPDSSYWMLRDKKDEAEAVAKEPR